MLFYFDGYNMPRTNKGQHRLKYISGKYVSHGTRSSDLEETDLSDFWPTGFPI